MIYIIVAALVVLSALFSGLNLGLMGLDAHELKRKIALGDKRAKKIYSIRKDGNFLLATILLGNAAVNSTLAIFLGSLTTGIIAAVASTGLIVVFGEIIPQSVFSRHALTLSAKTVWLVRLFMFIFYPIARPIASGLSRWLGDELPTIYSRHELMKIIEEHEDSHRSDIDADEEKIVLGALTFSHTSVEQISTPKEKVVALSVEDRFTKEVVEILKKSGHSRFPVYKGSLNHIVGTLYLRDLAGADMSQESARDIMSPVVKFVYGKQKLDEVLNTFLKTRHHLFIVLDSKKNVQGIVTIEDVLEEILGQEIIDEHD